MGISRARTAGPRPWLQAVHPNQSYTLTWKLPNNPQRFDSMLTMGKRTSNPDLLMGATDLFLSLSFALAGFLVWSAKPRDRVSRPCYAAALLMAFFLIASGHRPGVPAAFGLRSDLLFRVALYRAFPDRRRLRILRAVPDGRGAARRLEMGSAAVVDRGRDRLDHAFAGACSPTHGTRVADGHAQRPRSEHRGPNSAWCGSVTDISFCAARTCSPSPPAITHASRMQPCACACSGSFSAEWWGSFQGFSARWPSPPPITGSSPPRGLRTALSYYSLCTLTLAVMPFTIAYAVLRHRLMGIRLRLPDVYSGPGVRHILHILSLAPPAAILVFLWTARNTRISDFIRVSPLQMVLLAITLLYTCFRKEILDAVDRVLSRDPYDPDEVTRGLLEVLLEQQSAEAIASVAASRIEHSLKPRVLWCYFGKPQEHPRLAYSRTDDSTPRDRDAEAAVRELMDRGGTVFPVLKSGLVLPEPAREWITRNGIVLAVPIAPGPGADPAGILLLGENSKGQRYTATDLDVVENISRQLCFALKMHDLVTDRDRAVVARRHAEAAVDERSAFLAQMSHELRNPLQGLLGLSGSLLDTPLTEEQQQYAELIHRSGEWMVAIANDVLDFSKLEAGKLKLESVEFEWLPLLEELVAIAAERARSKGLDLVLRTDPAMPDASIGDAARIRQALLNLVDNAVKFTSEGWVVLRAAPAGTAPGSGVRLDVEDSGPGIPDHLRDRLFQPYEQASARRRHGPGARNH